MSGVASNDSWFRVAVSCYETRTGRPGLKGLDVRRDRKTGVEKMSQRGDSELQLVGWRPQADTTVMEDSRG